jgi:trk system potassium uptake protein TrkH
MDIRPILLVVGVLLATLGCAMMVPAIIDLLDNSDDWQVFAASGGLTLLVGLGFFLSARGIPKGMTTRQAFLMTVAAWVTLSGFGALPFYWSGIVPTYTDAFFEALSGLTTTGATVITGLDEAPTGILLWRGIMQWLGGLGVLVMAVAVLPMLQIGGMQIFKVEAFDTSDKILPRASQISGSITSVFIFLTFLCFLSYLASGMTMLEATVHAMTTVATGGFSTSDGSLGHFESMSVDLTASLFMVLGSIPFLLYVRAFNGSIRPLLQDSQVRTFLAVLTVAIVIVWYIERVSNVNPGVFGFVDAIFNVTSIITGTGFATDDYTKWGHGSVAFFFVIMFIGGCAGSTSCGIKIFRFQVLFQDVRQHINKIVYPHGVFVKKFNHRPLPENVSTAVMSFFFLYLVIFALVAVALSLTGLDMLTALSGAGSAISNVGPGLGNLIGPAGTYQALNDPAKWILCAAMLIGRLELFTVLVLFIPSFWRD